MNKPKVFETPQFVTRPFLPPREEFCDALEEIWTNRWLTNEGPLLRRFEERLQHRLDTQNLALFSNGTLALQIGLQGLGISGEVITTPFTFVATTHALYWNKIRPVFCDIDPVTCNIDPDKVEELITPWTTAILAVHVYGNPCDQDRLASICSRRGIFLLYDAAHAFGVRVKGEPISNFGDMSMFSFHATKLFHSFEGGLLAFKDSGLKSNLNYLKNFGFKNETEVTMPGSNAKLSEIHALMGLLMLDYVDTLIAKRKALAEVYRERLADTPGVLFIPEMKDVQHNYCYMPVRIQADLFGRDREDVYAELKTFNIHARRYFYPLVCDYPCYRSLRVSDPLAVARKVSKEILTLPIHQDLSTDDVHHICDALEWIQKQGRSRSAAPQSR